MTKVKYYQAPNGSTKVFTNASAPRKIFCKFLCSPMSTLLCGFCAFRNSFFVSFVMRIVQIQEPSCDGWQMAETCFAISWDILQSRTFLSDHRSLVISTQWTLLVLELVHSQVVAINTHLTQGSDAVVDVALGLLCAGRRVLRCRRLRVVSRTQRRWFGVAADLNERAGKRKQHERDCHKDSNRNQTTMSQLLTHCHYSCSCRFRPLSVGACGVDSRRGRFCRRSSLALWLGRS